EESTPCGNCDTCMTPPLPSDATVAAQKLRSAVIRLDREPRQRIGAGQVIDALRGNDDDGARAPDHESLSGWRVGEHLSESRRKPVIRQVLARGLLESHGNYGVLVTGEAAGPLLRGEEQISLRVDPVKKSGAKKAGSRRRGGPEVELDPADASLFEALRSWRGEQAKEQGVPAYVVFPDATLYGIVEVTPSTSSELGQVSGVGLKKLDRYGDSVLEVLAAHAG